MEEECDYFTGTPPELKEAATAATLSLLPAKSKVKYIAAYEKFRSWRLKSKAAITENVLIVYLTELSKIFKASSLWSIYSMLKSTIQIYDNIDISKFSKLCAFLKRQSESYKPKKAKILSEENVENFINAAPSNVYLATKVALIFGIMGALRIDELVHIRNQDVQKHGDILLIQIPKTKTKKEKSFTITGEYCKIVEQYRSLRPKDARDDHFFINFQNGICTSQPIGKNKFANMPRQIAQFLDLPDYEEYTCHSFRRSSTSMLANAGADIQTIMRHGAWKSSTTAQSYIENSIAYKKRTADLITSSINLNKKTYFDQKELKEGTSTNLPAHNYTSTSASSIESVSSSQQTSKFRFKTRILCSPPKCSKNNDEIESSSITNRVDIDEDIYGNYIIEEEITQNSSNNFNFNEEHDKVLQEIIPKTGSGNTLSFSNCNVTININKN